MYRPSHNLVTLSLHVLLLVLAAWLVALAPPQLARHFGPDFAPERAAHQSTLQAPANLVASVAPASQGEEGQHAPTAPSERNDRATPSVGETTADLPELLLADDSPMTLLASAPRRAGFELSAFASPLPERPQRPPKFLSPFA